MSLCFSQKWRPRNCQLQPTTPPTRLPWGTEARLERHVELKFLRGQDGASQTLAQTADRQTDAEAVAPHLDLALPHDPVRVFAVLLGDLGLVVTLLVAQNPQGLGAFQLDLKLLQLQERGVPC